MENQEVEEQVAERYCNLMNNAAFSWIFGRECNKDLLMALLNEFIPDKRITDITLIKQCHNSFSKELKSSVFDVSCTTDDGSYIDVEVQVCPQGWFDDRCLFYSTYLIQSQIPAGKDDYTLKPVYVVSIDAFARNHSKENDGRTLYSYSLLEDTTHELMTDSLHFVFVELKKFEKKWQDIDNDKERFYFCLKHLHELDELPQEFTQGIWAKLAQESEFAEMPLDVKKEYIRIMTTERDKQAQLNYARSQGLEEGLAKGLEEGLEAGRTEGIEQSKLEIARNMKAKGIDMETICQCTNLTMEQIAEL